MKQLARRHDIDLLRISAFLLLIFYHIGMVYVADWGYHVKSEYQSELLANLMLMVNQWRMPLLFVISGFATRQMMRKFSVETFIERRSFSLLMPLLFGILVIVPPQLYIEMLQKGDFNGSYWSFLFEFFSVDSKAFEGYQAGILPHVDVNHLWYLRELWVFTMIVVLLIPVINHASVITFLQRCCFAFAGWGLLVTAVVGTMTLKVLMLDQEQESSRNSVYFLFFICGYWLSQRASAWQLLQSMRVKLLAVGLLSNIGILLLYSQWPWQDPVQPLMQSTWLIISSVAAWSWVLAILGFGRTWMKQYEQAIGPPKFKQQLEYFNQAVYPYYILHQTIIVVSAYYLSQWALGPVVEPVLLITITVLGCALLFEAIRRVSFLRPLFGLKILERKDCSYFGEPRKLTPVLTLVSYGCLVQFAAIILF